MLKSRRWDYVTLQQASLKSHDLATYQPYADKLAQLIHKHAPQAQLLLHQTWAYRVDDPRFKQPAAKPGEPITQDAMYRGLSAAYHEIARQLNASIISVGEAFHLADTDPRWGFRPDRGFNFEAARPPALPDQSRSLHVGWRWQQKNGSSQLTIDGHHANTAGEYLGACVWYEVLYDQSVVGNPFIPAGMDTDFAHFLQQTAHRAVMTSSTVSVLP